MSAYLCMYEFALQAKKERKGKKKLKLFKGKKNKEKKDRGLHDRVELANYFLLGNNHSNRGR